MNNIYKKLHPQADKYALSDLDIFYRLEESREFFKMTTKH
jgi:hypothetical protein